jgi:DNA adenine methylase
MTSYHGGKQRSGKKIANIITQIQEDHIGYCEPFCGMLGVYRHVTTILGPDIQYKAGDINKSVIMMWNDAKSGWIPPSESTESHYNICRTTSEPSSEKGFVGHACSFGGQYFMGYKDKYLKSNTTEEKKKRLVVQSNRVCKIAEECSNVQFTNGDYDQFSNLKSFLIYCDPPYEGIKSRYSDEYGHKISFDHSKFWEWCRMMGKDNTVLVSGFSAPEDFTTIWSLEKARTAHGSHKSTGLEGVYHYTG